MKTDPVIDGVKFVRILFKEDMTAFSIGIVAEQIEEHDRLEELPVFVCEAEVMIFGIIIDKLLERTRAVGTILAERGEGDNMKAKRLADEVGGDFTPRQRILGEIPKRLLAA